MVSGDRSPLDSPIIPTQLCWAIPFSSMPQGPITAEVPNGGVVLPKLIVAALSLIGAVSRFISAVRNTIMALQRAIATLQNGITALQRSIVVVQNFKLVALM